MNRTKGLLVALSIATLAGCSSSYTIQVIDGMPNEVYLKFDKGADVKVGDIFVLYRMMPAPSGGSHAGHQGSSGPMNLKVGIGRVQVVRIVDEFHAEVKILSGRVENGVSAEKNQ